MFLYLSVHVHNHGCELHRMPFPTQPQGIPSSDVAEVEAGHAAGRTDKTPEAEADATSKAINEMMAAKKRAEASQPSVVDAVNGIIQQQAARLEQMERERAERNEKRDRELRELEDKRIKDLQLFILEQAERRRQEKENEKKKKKEEKERRREDRKQKKKK